MSIFASLLGRFSPPPTPNPAEIRASYYEAQLREYYQIEAMARDFARRGGLKAACRQILYEQNEITNLRRQVSDLIRELEQSG